MSMVAKRARTRVRTLCRFTLLVASAPLGFVTAFAGCGSSETKTEAEAVGSQAQPIAQALNYGIWNDTLTTLSHLAIHAALMPPTVPSANDAKILYFGGSQHDPQLPWGKIAWGFYDPRTSQLSSVSRENGITDDAFCSGHAHDKEGNLVIIGGNEYYSGIKNYAGEIPTTLPPTTFCRWTDPVTMLPTQGQMNIHKCPPPTADGGAPPPPAHAHFTGTKTTYVLSRFDRTLRSSNAMQRGRWYPTLVRGDETFFPNQLVAISGHSSANDPIHENDSVESYGGFRMPWMGRTQLATPLYPRVFLTGFDSSSLVVMATLTGATTALTNFATIGEPGVMFHEDIADSPPGRSGEHRFSAVLMPFYPSNIPPYRYPAGRIMSLAENTSHILDLDNVAAGWVPKPRPGGTGAKFRWNGIATILATGDIIYTGGVEDQQQDGWRRADGTVSPDKSVRLPDIYRDDLGRWDTATSDAQVSRNYHSVALLMPDGRVWTAGGNKLAGYGRTEQFNGDGRELRAEIFAPWYTRAGLPFPRPVVATTTPRTLPRGGGFTIRMSLPGTLGNEVSKVALIAPGSVTHGFDVDQRYVGLRITGFASSTVTVYVPDDPGVLPPGQYMLIVSRRVPGNPTGEHLPSQAYWVTLPSVTQPIPPCQGGQYCCDQWYCPPNGCPIFCPPNG